VHKGVGVVDALRKRDFRALWLGQLVSQIGDSFAIIAVVVVINDLTHSTLALGAMIVAVTLPQLLFGLIAGVFIDRFDRKLTMIVADLVRGLAILSLVTVHSPDGVWLFYVVGFVMGTLGVFFNPARNAVLPNIVEEELLLTANALTQAGQVVATVFGPALAGLVIGWFGTSFAFGFDFVTFVVSAIAIAIMRIPRRRHKDSLPTPFGFAPWPVSPDRQDRLLLPEGGLNGGLRVLWTQLVEGITFIRHNRTILNIMVTAGVAMLGLGAITVLGVKYLAQELHVGPTGYGFLQSVQGVGMVAGGVLIGNFASQVRANVLVGAGMMALGVSIASLAIAPDFTLVLVAVFVIGLCMVTARATLAAMTQAVVPDEKRGRVESALNTLITVATTTSMGLAGLLGDVLGLRLFFFLAGMATMLSGMMAFVTLQMPAGRQPSLPIPATQSGGRSPSSEVPGPKSLIWAPKSTHDKSDPGDQASDQGPGTRA